MWHVYQDHIIPKAGSQKPEVASWKLEVGAYEPRTRRGGAGRGGYGRGKGYRGEEERSEERRGKGRGEGASAIWIWIEQGGGGGKVYEEEGAKRAKTLKTLKTPKKKERRKDSRNKRRTDHHEPRPAHSQRVVGTSERALDRSVRVIVNDSLYARIYAWAEDE